MAEISTTAPPPDASFETDLGMLDGASIVAAPSAPSVLPISGRALPTGLMTYEEFLEWVDQEDSCEWVDGEVVPLATVDERHGGVTRSMSAVLPYWIEAHDFGRLLGEPFQMKTGPDLPGRCPDLIVVSREHLGLLLRNRLNGPADLAVEVISPDSVTRDRVTKFAEYEAGGVREYWIIDPNAHKADFYRCDTSGRFQTIAIDADGVFHSEALPGLWLKVEWLWEPHPPLLDVLRAWGLI